MKRVLTLALAGLLSGCVTHYRGPTPDFSLKEEAAKKEIEKFEFHFAWWAPAPGYFMMGPEQAIYTGDSVRPLMQTVSPESVKIERKAQTWEYVRRGTLIVAAIYLLADRGDWGQGDWAVFGGLLVVSAGVGIYGGSLHSDAVDQYNRDLRGKFSPGLAYSFTY